ncbi:MULTISPECIES: ABC transporter permease subunit [unclassified Rhodococcus (in: high G+C Gram-positive bacteria)]|nr:ABC transporter permease subunit [Rhodococcus sp. BL-253-APC-6A1W]NME80155.1 ABC transporter permease subunit [Rhodococcus sp. 105337]
MSIFSSTRQGNLTLQQHKWRATHRVAGILAMLAVWQLLAATVFSSYFALPTPTAIVAQAVTDWSMVFPNLVQTASEAARGWLFGNAAAFVLATVFILIRPIERVATQVALALYCLPVIAIAPILTAVLDGDRPQVVIAAQSVFFTTLVAVMVGAKAADQAAIDVVRTAGGSRRQEFVRVTLPSALPATFGGLRIAAPAAVLGAIIGEYLGADSGLGVAMVYAQQSLDVERTWALALYATMLAGAAYLATAAVERRVCSWSATMTGGTVPRTASGSIPKRIALTAGTAAGAVLGSLVLWQVAIMGLNPYFAKGPADVWRYLATPGSERDQLISALGTTTLHASYGYLAGTVAAFVVAVSVLSWPAVEAAVMPVAVALRAVPLVAMTPLIALVFGRDVATVVVIAGIVTFFPSLVTIVTGLRSVPSGAIDLLSAYGASRFDLMVRARIPYALPSVFAAARIAAPSAVMGALLAEWLATGDGIGFLMLRASTGANYGRLWSSVVLITVVSLLAYALATAAENALSRNRFH